LLQVTRSGIDVCKGAANVRLGHPVIRTAKKKSRKAAAELPTGPEETLFANLRRLRLLLARKLSLPPYMIFADSVLVSMSVLKPADAAALREIKGVGDNKRDRYGKAFLSVIAGADPESIADEFQS